MNCVIAYYFFLLFLNQFSLFLHGITTMKHSNVNIITKNSFCQMMIMELFTLYCNNYNLKYKACQYYSSQNLNKSRFSLHYQDTALHCCSVLQMRPNLMVQYFMLQFLLFLFRSDWVGGCELEQPSLQYWTQVEGMYNHQREKEMKHI